MSLSVRFTVAVAEVKEIQRVFNLRWSCLLLAKHGLIQDTRIVKKQLCQVNDSPVAK